MTIYLPDLPAAVINYLAQKVTVTAEVLPNVGNVVNPGEPCRLVVRVKNATAAEGGIALTNVRYQVDIKNPEVMRVFVPPANQGRAINEHGLALTPGSLVAFMTYDPADAGLSYLHVGGMNTVQFNGQAGAINGTTSLLARIYADPDIDQLFPRNYSSAADDISVAITG
jgi:hypothetical protein